MTNLYPPKPGEGNGKALGYIWGRRESRERLLERWNAGELAGASPEIIKANLAFRDGGKV